MTLKIKDKKIFGRNCILDNFISRENLNFMSLFVYHGSVDSEPVFSRIRIRVTIKKTGSGSGSATLITIIITIIHNCITILLTTLQVFEGGIGWWVSYWYCFSFLPPDRQWSHPWRNSQVNKGYISEPFRHEKEVAFKFFKIQTQVKKQAFKTRYPDGRCVNVWTLCQYINASSVSLSGHVFE